ncbi:unnamed protein product [Protopolystoma xenopodis]|uniref:Uncharacterized protein n=1 Tax=Protopolystoma xenopodis TaxID=117903 RepID=A0A3S5FFX2_9PLAT|nr:unnamed protein product [Protopolystoma xenopodis]
MIWTEARGEREKQEVIDSLSWLLLTGLPGGLEEAGELVHFLVPKNCDLLPVGQVRPDRDVFTTAMPIASCVDTTGFCATSASFSRRASRGSTSGGPTSTGPAPWAHCALHKEPPCQTHQFTFIYLPDHDSRCLERPYTLGGSK